MAGIPYPVKVTDIKKFELNNPDISINVFSYEHDDQLYPVRITKNMGRARHINLLLLSDNEGNTHYCLVKNLSHLLSHLTRHDGQSYYCHYCLHRFMAKKTLDDHLPLCSIHGAQKTLLPSENDKVAYFKNYTYTHKVPLTIYADLESYVVPLQNDESLSSSSEDEEEDPDTPTIPKKKSHSINTAKHVPSGFCYVIVNSEGRVVKPPVSYTGPDVIDTFFAMLLAEVKELLPLTFPVQPVIMTPEDHLNFDNATECHLCHQPLGGDKVLNHHHLTGKYLGAAHNACNLNYKVPRHVPVFFHNLKGYDCHHLMQGLGKFKTEQMSCIAKSSEQYISFSLESLRFLDSLQFLIYSLDTLVKNLSIDGPSNFPILRQCFTNHHDLLIRKGVFPYSWFTSPDKLDFPQLPSRHEFFNDLTQTKLSVEDYQHAQAVWEAFEMRSMRDYHDLYLKTDVLLLADVFENFRSMALRYYEIDPCNVYSAPGLAWQAMLKMTNVRLDLLTDIDQHLFIERGIRGGVAMIPHRHARANNPLVPDYKSEDPTSYLMYLDCNNLYGTAMVQPLPESNFNWLSEEEISRLNITTIEDDEEIGFILEVDLHYPKRLHEMHSDYPLAPEHMIITEEMTSPYSKSLLKKLKFKPFATKKLVTTLLDKKNYVLHYRTLKLYLSLGLEITKIHRVLAFKQSTWLAPFINFNTQKRQDAKNKFEKDFFKLMNNATYGKSLENVRSRIDFKLITTERQLTKWTASPRWMNTFIFNEDLAGLSLKKGTILLNRPVYVGLTVLDLSKLVMYDFHYNWAVRKYGPKVRLCMTDTDSLFYHVETEDIYQDMRVDKQYFDTSEYPEDHPNYSLENMRVLGKFKDECNGKPPQEIVGLRAKCYSILLDEKAKEKKYKEKTVAKGVLRTAIEKQLKHELYKKCLFQRITAHTGAYTIRSVRHQLYTQHICKLSLCPYDDKRYVLADGVNTRAYGHYDLRRVRDIDEAVLFCEDEDLAPPPKRRRVEPGLPPALPPGVPSGSGL